MEMLKVDVDGRVIEVQKGERLLDIARRLGVKDVLMAELDGEVVELTSVVERDSKVKFLDFSHPMSQKAFWHTASHIMAQAVKRLFPHAKLGIGPAIENGFYYDFDYPDGFSAEDIEKIEAEMKRIVEEDYPVIKEPKK